MTTKISYLIESFKRKSSLQKWVDEQMVIARQRAYDNRSTIYKRELEDDLRRLNYIIPLWEIFKKLRKKSADYDVLIDIDRKGYITMQLTFPITQEELDEASQNKRNYIKEHGQFYASCCRVEEELYKVCHQRIEKVFKGITMNANGSYYPYGTSLIRWVDFVKC